MSNKAKAKATGTCLVTGEATRSKRTRFRPGMDARLKGMAIAVVRDGKAYSSLPAGARKIWDAGETLVGFKLQGGSLKKVGGFAMAAKGRGAKGKAKAKPVAKKAAKRVVVKRTPAAAPAAAPASAEG